MSSHILSIESPLGPLQAALNEHMELVELSFQATAESMGDSKHFDSLKQQLDDYWNGKLKTFDLRLAPAGTVFQRMVWKALQTIPYGETASYGDIARRLGKSRAMRAVGAANGRNPIPIIIPCHRVIGANRTLTGYAGGLDRKAHLLSLEGSLPEATQASLFPEP